jgi:hypothetical protein
MSQRITHYGIALYGIVEARRSPRPISALIKVSRRNRGLCEKHGHDWASIRRECVAELRRVDAARKGEAA